MGDWTLPQVICSDTALRTRMEALLSVCSQAEQADVLVSAEPVANPLSELTGVVAIHSLTDSALNRIKGLLESISQCKVEPDSSKVGNGRLRDLARSADLFVVVTGVRNTQQRSSSKCTAGASLS